MIGYYTCSTIISVFSHKLVITDYSFNQTFSKYYRNEIEILNHLFEFYKLHSNVHILIFVY